jgi:ComF family protein
VQEDELLCHVCFKDISFLNRSCKKCQEPIAFAAEDDLLICEKCYPKLNQLEFYNQMHCPLKYSKVVSSLILRFKNGQDFVVGNLLAKLLYARIRSVLHDDLIIVPVPLYRKRLIKRGYNQTLLLAKKLAQEAKKDGINLSVIEIIERIKDTNSQANKTISERAENVAGAFSVKEEYISLIKGKHVLILDDVITTGATTLECARVLNARARHYGLKIDIAAIARRVLSS